MAVHRFSKGTPSHNLSTPFFKWEFHEAKPRLSRCATQPFPLVSAAAISSNAHHEESSTPLQLRKHAISTALTLDRTRLPKKLAEFLTSAQLKQIHHVALGFEDSFLLTWRDNNGQDHIEAAGLPSELVNFLYARNAQRRLVRDIPNIRCILGPYNSSYFVHDKSAYIWMNLPEGLLSALQSRIKDGNWIDRPRIVALGAGSNFLLVTENHSAIWELENYKTVAKLLDYSRSQERGILEVHNIVLHCYRFESFITQSRNGTIIYNNLPPHEVSSIKAMISPIIEDTPIAERSLFSSRDDGRKGIVQRRPSGLQQRAQLRREWSDRKQEVTAQTKGFKFSLSLSISMGGISRMLG
ncbi:Nn.00g024140.m01.CDS01 [Neocucurbitaria sp. VM-36]